ncbi:hypothetical protein OXX80_006076 [Metschnikowia pulcherrima]
MDPFAVSHLVGYESHLPTKNVRLPLKYLPAKGTQDASEKYTSTLLGHSGYIDVSSQKGHFFSLIQAGVTSDRKHIRLTPILVDEATLLGVSLQSLEFVLPHPILGKGTFTHHFLPSTTDEPCIVIDFLDESFLLVTLRVELSDFLVGNAKSRLSLDNINEWVNISVPYSFELRSPPFMMKALDAQNLIVSMNDGGLLHFRRSSPLLSFDIYNFTDAAPAVSLSLGALFARSKRTENEIGGISSNAAVDIAYLNADDFVILTLNKTVKVYSLRSHRQLKQLSDLTASHGRSEWVNNVPNKYFELHSHSDSKTLSLVLPTENEAAESKCPAYTFINWDISDGKLEQHDTLKLEVDDLNRPSHADLKSLKIQDFQILQGQSEVDYFVLYKSNTYSEVVRFKQAKSTKEITLITRSLTQQASVFAELSSHRDISYYVNTVFDSGMFDKRMVAAALDIFIQNSEKKPSLFEATCLRDKVTTTVSFISSATGVSESSTWYKFALICLEFRRSSQEALSLAVQQDMILCSEVNAVGVYRKAHSFEVAFHEPAAEGLTSLISSFSSRLSVKTFRRFREEVSSFSSMDTSRAEALVSKYLAGKISDEESGTLMNKLDNIPEVVDQIQTLIGTSNVEGEIIDEESLPSAGEGMGMLSLLLTSDIIESIRKSHEAVLINLLLLLLLCEANDNIIEFMNQIVKKLRVYKVMSEISSICYTTYSCSSPIERSTVCAKEKSMFWGVALRNHPVLQQLIQRNKYIAAFDYYAGDILGKKLDETILDVVIDLLNRGEHEIVLNQFAPMMDRSLPINSFLIGIVFLLNRDVDKFYEMLTDYALFTSVNTPQTKTILIDNMDASQLSRDFLSGIFIGPSDSAVTKSNYYHKLAQLINEYMTSSLAGKSPVSKQSVDKQHLYALMIELENKAIEILEDSAHGGAFRHLEGLFLRSHLSTTLGAQKFKDALVSLAKLSILYENSGYEEYFEDYIKALLKANKLETLFLANEKNVFANNYSLVDSILLKLANEDLVLTNALKCYEILYSWRLLGPSTTDAEKKSFFDKRGAAEALYLFVTRFQLEKDTLSSESTQLENFQYFKLKILELFKIILTTLKTFEAEEDRWIRKRTVEKTWEVITLTELNIEYLRWMKELEGELLES